MFTIVRTKFDWPNLTGFDPVRTNVYCVSYSRHYSHGYFFLFKYCLVRYLRKNSLSEVDIIMLGGSFHFCLDSTLNTKKFKWTRSIASVQLQLFDFLYIVRSKKGAPPAPLRGPCGLCGALRACLHGSGGPKVGEITRLGGVKKITLLYM